MTKWCSIPCNNSSRIHERGRGASWLILSEITRREGRQSEELSRLLSIDAKPPGILLEKCVSQMSEIGSRKFEMIIDAGISEEEPSNEFLSPLACWLSQHNSYWEYSQLIIDTVQNFRAKGIGFFFQEVSTALKLELNLNIAIFNL